MDEDDKEKKKCIGKRGIEEENDGSQQDEKKKEGEETEICQNEEEEKEGVRLEPISSFFTSHWEVFTPAAPARPTQVSIARMLKKPVPWPRPGLGENWHSRGGVGKRDILAPKADKSKEQKHFSRISTSKWPSMSAKSSTFRLSVVSSQSNNSLFRIGKKKQAPIPRPEHCAQGVRCVYDLYSMHLLDTSPGKSKEKVFPRDTRFEYRQKPPPEPPVEAECKCCDETNKMKEKPKRMGFEPPFWFLGLGDDPSRPILGSGDDYGKPLGLAPPPKPPTIQRLLTEYELDQEGKYIPGRIGKADEQNEEVRENARGYITRLEEVGLVKGGGGRGNQGQDASGQGRKRRICLCPLIKALQESGDEDACQGINRGPPSKGFIPDRICAHLKYHRPSRPPPSQFHWFKQPFKHCAQNLIHKRHPPYRPPIIQNKGKKAFPEMVFSSIMT